ncbi:MAG: hypothetical protein ABR555_08935 [Pyrinomonadaceae bacterium]
MRRIACLLLVASVLFLTGCTSYTSGLQQSIARADETAAIMALRGVASAENAYSLSNGVYGSMQQLTQSAFLDSRFSTERPTKNYVFKINVTPTSAGEAAFYSCNADPLPASDRIGRHFYIDSTSASIHTNDSQPATPSDPIMQ